MVIGYNAEYEDKRIYKIVEKLNIKANDNEVITSPIQVGFLLFLLVYVMFLSTIGLVLMFQQVAIKNLPFVVENIFAVHEALQKVEILCGDYEKTLTLASENTFFYLDPPYKPLTQTSNFNSYAKDEFGDEE